MTFLTARYPALRGVLPLAPIADLPTPVRQLNTLGNAVGHPRLWLKDDGCSGRPYGGNKVRKLAPILGSSAVHKTPGVLTFGFASSNHALATALYAHEMRLPCILVLNHQPPTPSIAPKLGAAIRAGAFLYGHDDPTSLTDQTTIDRAVAAAGWPEPATVIPPGGSSPLGTTGFVDAAFELQEDIDKDRLPEPDLILLPLGTMGTAAGLALGLAAAGLSSRIVAVGVVDPSFGNRRKLLALIRGCEELLNRKSGGTFTVADAPDGKVTLTHDYLGEGYTIPTPAAAEACRLMQDHEGITLETTYSGKAMAACIDFLRRGWAADKNVLFWNTYNTRPLPEFEMNRLDVPDEFKGYFFP